MLAAFSSGVTTVGQTARTLDAGVGGQTWALSAMSLGLASALLAVGALADDLGRRRVLAWSAGLLAGASALAAAAPTMTVFVAARVVQGVGGAGVLTASLAAIGHAFPGGAARTRAAGIWGAALGGGIALGPLQGAGSPTRSGGAAATGCRRSPPRRSSRGREARRVARGAPAPAGPPRRGAARGGHGA